MEAVDDVVHAAHHLSKIRFGQASLRVGEEEGVAKGLVSGRVGWVLG